MFEVSDGVVYVELSTEATTLLSQLPALLSTVGVVDSDPGYEVLHRPLYADDSLADAELSDLAAKEVDRQRVADRQVVHDIGAGATSMTEREAHGFLRSVNEARLVLAARAGVFEEGAAWEDRISQDPALAAVAWLGYLQGELIEQLGQS
jgi:hypothetical protein